jgi:beta-glucosidase/6-phospho-beta-glucosidase/beta-galactosidase
MKETQGDLLPKFTAEESKLLRSTTVDFFSVNFYCGYYVWAPAPGSPKELVSALCCCCSCVGVLWFVLHTASGMFY